MTSPSESVTASPRRRLWLLLAADLGVCGAAVLLRLGAWWCGTRADYTHLLGIHLLRLLLLLVGYVLVLETIAVGRQNRRLSSRDNCVLASACAGVLILACGGCYPLWAVAVALLAGAVAFVVALHKELLAGGWKPVALRAVVAVLLYAFAWYQCAAVTDTALHGLGERLEATAGSERLMAWAGKLIAETPPGHARTLERTEIPDYVDEMMGRIPGWPWVRVSQDDGGVVMIVNGSGYGFSVTIRPGQREPPPWPWGEVQWRPGITLHTVSK